MSIIFFLSLLSIYCITNISPILGQCLEDQKSLLLGLKNNLSFNSSASLKLVRWNRSTDCCSWDGVECNVAGHVISLQLDQETISSGIENSKYLFRLHYLEELNLAYNNFNNIQIPKGLYNLTNLTHLNLSNAGFAGQIPSEISGMRRLVSLDLSVFPGIGALKLENPNLKMLVQNLTGLKELYLDYVNISAQGSEWCQVLSSSLPDLRVLSLCFCNISGPLDSSLTGLRSLSVLRLDGNNLTSSVPNSFANFSKLTTLSLSGCSLLESVPKKIFQIPTLQDIDLSSNELLSGKLPEFPWNGSLRTIVLHLTNFSGLLPDSISNLRMLSRLDLSFCRFNGPIPLFHLSKKLTYIDLAHNSLTGSLSSLHFGGLPELVYINLGYNLLGGSIPSSLFALPSLQELDLSNNEFHGLVQEFSNSSSSLLEALDLSSNHLEGPIPKCFSELEKLKKLSLSSNDFNGTVQLEIFKNPKLSILALSFNDLFVDTNHSDSGLPLFPWISELYLASCKLQKFPLLSRQSRLMNLDLSSNQLKGKIPNWVWEIGNRSLESVNLSFNRLDDFQKPYKFPSFLGVIDLHSNQLQGELPILPEYSPVYVDFSFNNFSNSIPADIGDFISYSYFFSVSNNNLTGEIPISICKATYLLVLDLSGNALTGTIPPCLPKENLYLGVLSLARNNLSGDIPDTFSVNCSLRTLNLEKNVLKGKIPGSVVNCPFLEVLNLGSNRIEDTFPCMLMKMRLRVLILRSNKFYGDLHCSTATHGWPNLQIVDISNNNFGGDISELSFSNWRGMISAKDNENSKYNHIRYDLMFFMGSYYQDAVTVTMKGLEMELPKILIIFTCIDFSRNKFKGSIPATIGDLKSLYLLNLSHNAIIGAIPASIGNLKQLGSLDLSVNHLIGTIPVELASLTFLSFLNLSFNNLFGMIPEGPQLQTFQATSYEGNAGLCGIPLAISCNDEEVNGVSPPKSENGQVDPKKEINWDYISAAVGFAVGIASTIWLLLHCKKWRDILSERVDQILLKVFPYEHGGRSHGRRVVINQAR